MAVVQVIPYTSIIDQTDDFYTNLLGNQNVLAHYSTVDYATKHIDDLTEEDYRHILASENWDMPIIITTAEQFYESLYSNKPSKCRKLHNISNSVIIFDEVQTIPLEYLTPCLYAINKLVEDYKSTSVLCTATQPFPERIFNKIGLNIKSKEIYENPQELYNKLKRTNIKYIKTQTEQELINRLKNERQTLCVVNLRATAQSIYQKLPSEGSYCLTTLLCPADRKKQLEEIKERLDNGLPCRVVSTSLADNMPRIDAETDIGIISAECVKRKIRNLVDTVHEGEEGNRIYIKGDKPLNCKDAEAFKANGIDESKIQGKSAKESVKKIKKSDPDIAIKLRDYMCENFFDNRTFGAVMTNFAKTNLGESRLKGPVAFSNPVSVDPIYPQMMTLTRQAITRESDAENKNNEFGHKWEVPYGLYKFYGNICPYEAKKTGFSEKDLKLLLDSMINMFEIDKCAARFDISLRKLIVFQHSTMLGDTQDWHIFDAIHVTRNEGVDVPRQFSDYTITIDEDDIPDTIVRIDLI